MLKHRKIYLKGDKMKDTLNYFDKLVKSQIYRLHTCMLAKIVSYDPTKMTAVVQPMTPYKVLDGEVTMPQLLAVPVMSINTGSFVISTPYEVDDIVVIGFAERDISGILETGEFDTNGGQRIFSLNDAIILGGIHTFETTTGVTSKTDLTIMNKEHGSKVILKSDGSIVIDADSIELGDGATEGVPLGATLKDWLDSHTHISATSGSPTSAPTSSSPSPSSTAKVK